MKVDSRRIYTGDIYEVVNYKAENTKVKCRQRLYLF